MTLNQHSVNESFCVEPIVGLIVGPTLMGYPVSRRTLCIRNDLYFRYEAYYDTRPLMCHKKSS